MTRFVGLAVVLQLAMVGTGHFVEAARNLSGVLGTTIPFALAVWYGATSAHGYGHASRGGLLIGLVGAVAGTVTAILLGDATWMLLTFAPLASALTGWLGGLVGRVGHRAGVGA